MPERVQPMPSTPKTFSPAVRIPFCRIWCGHQGRPVSGLENTQALKCLGMTRYVNHPLLAKGNIRSQYLLILQRKISFLRAHLIPHDLHVPLQSGVARIFMQRAGEPVIRQRQVAMRAVSCGVHCRKRALRFGVVAIGGRCQILLGASAIR